MMIFHNRVKHLAVIKKWYLRKYYLKDLSDINRGLLRYKIYVPQSFNIPHQDRYECYDYNPLTKSCFSKKITSSLEGIKINQNIPFRERYECTDF